MSKRAIVTSVPGAVHNRTRVCTPAEARRLLEGLRAAYQGFGREGRQQIKTLMLMLSRALIEAHRLSSSEAPSSSIEDKEEPAASDVDRQKTESAAIDGMTAE